MYTFDFGDGTKWSSDFLESGERITCLHSYSTLGLKTITVTAINTHGGQSSNSINIEVIEEENSNNPPNKPIISSGSVEGYLSEPYLFSFIGSDIDGDKISYEIDWGDGTFSNTILYTSGTEVSLSHTWAVEGTYIIKVRTYDENEDYSEWSEPYAIIIYDPNGIIITAKSFLFSQEIS